MAESGFNVEDLAEVKFSTGETVMGENKKSNRVYILGSGSVTVSVGGNEICKIDEPMSIFGEISALLDCPHTATVKADNECSFYTIENLKEYCKANPETTIHLAETLAQRLVNMNNHFTEFKNELNSLSALDAHLSFAKKISNLVLRMDSFWGREIFESRPKKKKKK